MNMESVIFSSNLEMIKCSSMMFQKCARHRQPQYAKREFVCGTVCMNHWFPACQHQNPINLDERFVLVFKGALNVSANYGLSIHPNCVGNNCFLV